MVIRSIDEIYGRCCKLGMDLLGEVNKLHNETLEQKSNNHDMQRWWQEEKKRADGLQAELQKLQAKDAVRVPPIERKVEA